MKKIQLLSIFIFSIITTSCTSSEDVGQNSANFLPLTTGDQWTYDVVRGGTTQTDVLTVGNDITLNGKTYKQMQASTNASGFYTLTLQNNGVRKEGSKWYLQGNLDFGSQVPIPVNFAINDLVILDGNASAGTVLGNINGTLTEEVGGFPLNVTYNLKTISQGNQSNFTTPAPQNETYQNVKVVKVELRLKVTTTQTLIPGFPPVTVTILDEQTVLNSMQYYAQNIGMVYNNSDLQYNLAIDPTQFNLPIPQSTSQNQKEFLVNYQVAN